MAHNFREAREKRLFLYQGGLPVRIEVSLISYPPSGCIPCLVSKILIVVLIWMVYLQSNLKYRVSQLLHITILKSSPPGISIHITVDLLEPQQLHLYHSPSQPILARRLTKQWKATFSEDQKRISHRHSLCFHQHHSCCHFCQETQVQGCFYWGGTREWGGGNALEDSVETGQERKWSICRWTRSRDWGVIVVNDCR